MSGDFQILLPMGQNKRNELRAIIRGLNEPSLKM